MLEFTCTILLDTRAYEASWEVIGKTIPSSAFEAVFLTCLVIFDKNFSHASSLPRSPSPSMSCSDLCTPGTSSTLLLRWSS